VFREIFSFTQKILNKKFPERTPLITDFIFFHFICPVIVNPTKYEILEDVPAHALPGLINVSKLLKDVALNATDKWQHEEEVVQFIEKHHPFIVQHMNRILVRLFLFEILILSRMKKT
jgi:hypothetical protein